LAVLGLGFAGAEAGHFLAYELRFGSAAMQVQGSGAHVYFPALAKTGIGLAAIVFVAGLFIVGVARMAAGRRLDRAPAPSFVPLLAVVYTVQLAFFAFQETVEALLVGGHPLSAPLLLLWGTAGQLPVAIVVALALRWLLARVGPAISALRVASTEVYERFVAAPTTAWPLATDVVPVLDVLAAAPRRGPPSF
jgi:hypothetical protein